MASLAVGRGKEFACSRAANAPIVRLILSTATAVTTAARQRDAGRDIAPIIAIDIPSKASSAVASSLGDTASNVVRIGLLTSAQNP